MRLLIILTTLLVAIAAASQPVIISLLPSSGATNTSVSITGSGFSPVAAGNIVRFGSSMGTVTAATANSLSVTVPAGTSSGVATVTSNSLTAYANIPFITTFPGANGPFTASSFNPKVNLATSAVPYDIVSCDLDGDNKPELVTGSLTTNIVSILKNASVPGTISFPTRTDLVSGNSPGYLAIGDIDGNGFPDIVAGNSNDGNISVFLNTTTAGTLAFAPRVNFAFGGSYTLAVHDLDGDGKPEIIATRPNGLSVLRNLSTPGIASFAAPVSVATVGTLGLAILDVNANGKPEIITLSGGSLSILNNNSTPGTISFVAAVTFPVGLTPFAVAAGNLDDDARPDIAVANVNSNSISVLKNTGTGNTISFAPPLNLPIGWQPYDVKIADINGDGKQDIIAPEYDNTKAISVFRNTSTTTLSFDPRVAYSTGGKNWRVAVSDLDSDGKQDLAAIIQDSSRVVVLQNRLGGLPAISSFSPASSSEASVVTIKGQNLAGTSAVTFGGIAATAVVATSDTSVNATVGTGASGSIAVITPGGTATVAGFVFTQRPVITSFTPLTGPVGQRVKISGTNFSPVAANNMVTFGSVRATVVNASDTALFVNVPPGSTYEPIAVTIDGLTCRTKQPFDVTFSDGSLSSSTFIKKFDDFQTYNDNLGEVAIADYDGDGRTDMIVANSSKLAVYRNTTVNGILSFAPRTSFDTRITSTVNKVLAADLDGDGKPDLVCRGMLSNSFPSYAFIFKNTSTPGNISFVEQNFYTLGTVSYSLTVGDLDGDGKLDIVAPDESVAQMIILRNTSNPAAISFSNRQVFITKWHGLSSISIGDIDGDNKADIVANYLYDTLSFCIFRNTSTVGNISLAQRLDYNNGNNVNCTQMGDIDGDGKTDLILGNYPTYNSSANWTDSSISIIRNISTPGTIVLAPPTYMKSAVGYGLHLSDVNGDGKPDLVVQTFDNYNVMKNNSTAGVFSFDPKIDYATPGNSTGIYGFKAGDLDGDGKPDMAIVRNSDQRVLVHINQNGADLKLCPNGSGTIISNLTGATYQWQVNTGSGFVAISNNANYAGATTATLQLNTIPSSWYGYSYRCVVNNNSSKVFTLKFVNEWTGDVNSSWEEPGNWSCYAVPDINTDVIISSGNVVLSSNVTVNRLHLDADVIFRIVSGYQIIVRH